MCECLWVSTPTVTLAGTSAILSAAIGLLCWMELVVGSRARGHYCDGALTSLLSGHCSLGAVFLRWSLTARRQIELRARSLYSKGSTPRQQPPPGIFAVFRTTRKRQPLGRSSCWVVASTLRSGSRWTADPG